MEPLARLIRRARYWLGARRHAADLAAELEDHRIRLQSALEADGIPPSEAAARSRRAMGNVTLAREDARHVWIASAIERVWADLRYGIRALRREPAFAATALLTLTLGIFTTTTVFTIVDAEMWKPLPFRDPDRLVAVSARKPGPSGAYEAVSVPDFLDWRAGSSLTDFAAYRDSGRRVLRRGVAESVRVLPVTANYFTVLNHVPRFGRGFEPTDEHARVAIVSDRGWKRLFEGATDVVGQVLTLDGADYTVVGVNAGQHLGMGAEPDLFVVFDTTDKAYADRLLRQVSVIGRVRPDATVAQAQLELQAIAARLAEAYPEDHAGHRVELSDLRREHSGYGWRPLFFFLAAAVAVLLLSCLNVAGLLLARALRRQREFAIRGALGGGRGSLARQLIVEGALLAVPSAVAASFLGMWALQFVATRLPELYFYRGSPLVLDARIALVVIALAGVTTILLSLAPMFFAHRLHLNVMLGQGARTGTSPRHVRVRNGLLVAQLTLTLVLVTAAGLFVQSFVRLINVPIGFEPKGRLSFVMTLSGPRYAEDAPVRLFADEVLQRVSSIAGVESASVDTSSPLGSGPPVPVAAADGPRPQPGREQRAILRAVTSDYFRTLGMRLVAGRPFSRDDVAGGPRVAIVNEYLAGQLFPGQNPVGQRIELLPGARAPWTRRPGAVTIVGVVPNIKDVGLNEISFGNLYVPFAQAPSRGIEVLAKTALPAATAVDAIRRAVAEVDPALPVIRVQTLEERVALALSEDRFNLMLIGSFALAGIILAAVGIYGAMACAVRERTREFGVRLALGQPPVALVRSTLWQSARLALVATVIGLAVIFALARILGNSLYLVPGEHNGLLYGVTTTDPVAIAAAAIALIAIATLSGVFPAREASRVDPLIALRQE